jgi:hypothetical protein
LIHPVRATSDLRDARRWLRLGKRDPRRECRKLLILRPWRSDLTPQVIDVVPELPSWNAEHRLPLFPDRPLGHREWLESARLCTLEETVLIQPTFGCVREGVRGQDGLDLCSSREHSDNYRAPTKYDSLRRRLPNRSLEGCSGLLRGYPLGGVDQGSDRHGLKPTIRLIDVASNLTSRIAELGTPAKENPRPFDLPCNGDEDGPACMRAAADSCCGPDSVTGADAS